MQRAPLPFSLVSPSHTCLFVNVCPSSSSLPYENISSYSSASRTSRQMCEQYIISQTSHPKALVFASRTSQTRNNMMNESCTAFSAPAATSPTYKGRCTIPPSITPIPEFPCLIYKPSKQHTIFKHALFQAGEPSGNFVTTNTHLLDLG